MGFGGALLALHAAGSICNDIFMVIYVKNVSIFFSIFVVFNHNFILYTDFTHIADSNPANDDVTNSITH